MASRNDPCLADIGDEQRNPSKIGSFTKGLPHDGYGEVDPGAYDALIDALASGDQREIDAVPLASTGGIQRKLVDPLAGLAFTLEGTDSHQLFSPPPPTFAGAEQAGEMVELYWMALLRDVPFAEYHASPLAQAAAADLGALSDFKGPRERGAVTTGTLFRGVFPGDLVGPYVSQLRWLPAPFAASFIEQRITSTAPGVDYVTTFPDWLAIQNGRQPAQSPLLVPGLRYVVDGRDYAQWVHLDVSLDTYLAAFYAIRGLGVPWNPGNPYLGARAQEGFATFGYQHGISLMSEVATRAFVAVWFQKWFVHRRQRPEDFGGRVQLTLAGVRDYPLHHDLLGSAVLPEIHDAGGNWLLSQAYPEGSPLHPSYGEGHGAVAGACVTILKAFFDGSFVIPAPVVPVPGHPGRLMPHVGPPLTLEGELNKLASNVALARDFAGVHWRSDALSGLLLGEAVAISVLRDQRPTFAEDFSGFTFTRFDGTTITV